MPLTNKQVEQIKEELHSCTRPLFFHHDDPDGVCSFLLLYRMIKEGKGVIVKSVPRLDEKFLSKVEEYGPDKVFVLDLAMLDEDFAERVHVPIIWIDHHEPKDIPGVKAFNPRVKDPHDNTPTTYMAWQVTQDDLWLAAIGCTGDWMIADFLPEFQKQYPDLLPEIPKDPGALLFDTPLGEITKIFSFVLKGATSDVNKCIKVMTRLESSYEVLQQETPRGKYIHKRYEKINTAYEALKKEAMKNYSKKDKILFFRYTDDKMSFTGDLANELLHRHPDKTIIIGREKSGEMRMSLRSKKELPPILEKALAGLQGHGGGHEHACGAGVALEDFDEFMARIRELL